MKFAHLLSRFYFEAWGIRPDKHLAMGQELQRHLKGADIIGPTWYDGEPVVPQMEVAAGVAVIPVYGVLGKHLSKLDLFCGGCDYDHIVEMIEQAESDPTVHTVIFDINSPGGMCVGSNECADRIDAMTIETLAVMDYQACSNGYLLASQCDSILATGSSVVGSIGTYIAALDTTREWELAGWKLELFRAGNLKGAGMDGKAWTDEERAHFQRVVDECNGQFKAAVSARRPQVADSTMQGQWFSGREALALGLVDDLVASVEDAVRAAILGNTLGG